MYFCLRVDVCISGRWGERAGVERGHLLVAVYSIL